LTLALMLLFVGGLPWLDLALAHWDESKFECVLSVASPGHLFATVDYLKPRALWYHLELQHALAWAFLLLSCVCVPRAWKEKSNGTTGWRPRLLASWNFGGKNRRLAFRRKLLGRNPIQWLAARHRGMLKLVLTLVIFSVAALVWSISLYPKTNRSDELGFVILPYIPFLALWISMRAADFISTARRNGALELILVTGVTPKQIVRGQWTALWRTFFIPVSFLAGLMIAADVETIHSLKGNGFTGAQYQQVVDSEIIGMVVQVTYAIANALALAWFGMWMGLTSRNTSLAVLKTICIVCVLPFLLEIFIEIISDIYLPRLLGGSWGTTWPTWLNDVFIALLDLSKVLLLIFWSRWRLLKTMREKAALSGQPRTRRWRPGGISSVPVTASGTPHA
jgi:hypothetical protein